MDGDRQIERGGSKGELVVALFALVSFAMLGVVAVAGNFRLLAAGMFLLATVAAFRAAMTWRAALSRSR